MLKQFLGKLQTVPETETAIAEVPRPVPVSVTVPTVEPVPVDVEYLALARSVGWTGVDALHQERTQKINDEQREYRLRRFLAEHGICIYDTQAVETYMRGLVDKLNTEMQAAATRDRAIVGGGYSWQWFPLGGSRNGGPTGGWTEALHNVQRENGEFWQEYVLPIPVPVLMTVKAIRDEFPAAEFFVTAITPRVDPFMAVKLGNSFFVIERWDEPAFRQ